MPKRIYKNDEERKEAFVRQRLECYKRHKEVYNAVTNRSYYRKLLKQNPNRSEELNTKIDDLTKRINEMRSTRAEHDA